MLAQLGTVLDVVVDAGEHYLVRPGGATDLLWTEDQKAIVWWPGRHFELGELEATTKRHRKAARVFERWSVWEATQMGRSTASGAERFERYPAVTIGYHSDKFGKPQNYEHDFGRGVLVYRPIGTPGPWVVRGGRLRITAHGIEG